MLLLAIFLPVELTLALAITAPHLQNGSSELNARYFKDAIRDTLVNDTFFLVRRSTPSIYHAIYIDNNRRSPERRWLLTFSPRKGDLVQTHGPSSLAPGATRLPIAKAVRGDWVPLFPYKGKLYIYRSSVAGASGRLRINRESVVRWSLEGPYSSHAAMAAKDSGGMYHLQLPATVIGDTTPTALTIRSIDGNTGLSLFEFSDEPEAYRYQLYIPVKKVHHYDLIVNHCRGQKAPEYEFERLTPATLHTVIPELARPNR